MKDKRGNQRESNVANRGAWLVVKFFVLFWAVLNRTVLPPAWKEAEGVKQVQASKETGGESLPAVPCRFSRQADGRRCHVPGIGPHPPEKLSSVHPPLPPEWQWGQANSNAAFQRWVIYTAAVPPAPQRAVPNAPRPMFNSWQTHAFSVTLAFMATAHNSISTTSTTQGHGEIFMMHLSQSGWATTPAMGAADASVGSLTKT